jgi:hypothetical protein
MIEPQLIEIWKAHTDFSILEMLKLEPYISQDTFAYLAANSSLPSLKRLVLRLAGRHIDRRQTNEFFDIARSFLYQLPPLETLELTGELFRLNMNSILGHHGAALRQLSLSPSEGDKALSPEDITKIGTLCPLLDDLVLTLHRSKGDATEVACYKALGSIQRLENLSLTLDALNHAIPLSNAHVGYDDDDDDAEYPEIPNDPSFDDFDRQFFKGGFLSRRDQRNGHVRDAFINSTVDVTLARAIFWTVSEGKAVGSFPLERLRIQGSGGGNFENRIDVGSVHLVVRELGGSWLCERNQRDDRRQELIVRELPLAWRGSAIQPERLPPDVEPIFRRLWPALQKGGDDWRKEWCSFPLQTLGS